MTSQGRQKKKKSVWNFFHHTEKAKNGNRCQCVSCLFSSKGPPPPPLSAQTQKEDKKRNGIQFSESGGCGERFPALEQTEQDPYSQSQKSHTVFSETRPV